MGDNISGRQTGAWCFCAVSVPAILTASRMGWGWALLAGAVAAAYFGLTGSLVPGGAVDLARETAAAFGRGPGRIVLALGGVFCVLALSDTASRAGAAFPDGTAWLAGAAILLLAALANEKGAFCAARACGALALILAGLYLITGLSAAAQTEAKWFQPWGTVRQSVTLLPSLLVPCCIRYLPGRKEGTHGAWLAGLCLGPAAVAAITSGCLSPRLAQSLEQPFYTVSQSLSVLDVMERFEPLVSAALLMGFFALASLLAAAAKAQLEKALPVLSGKRWTAGAVCLAAFLLQGVCRMAGEGFWMMGAAIFWGTVPLLTLLIVAIKNN